MNSLMFSNPESGITTGAYFDSIILTFSVGVTR